MAKASAKKPKLRFSRFNGEWQEYALADLISKTQSGLSRKLSSSDIGLPVIRSNNLQNNSIDTSNISYWYDNDPQGADTQNYILKRGDLLVNFINSRSRIGKFAFYNDELHRDTIFTTNIMRVQFHDECKARLTYYTFQLKRYSNFIESITKPAVNQASFTTIDFRRFIVTLPGSKEQEKIANFLTAMDRRIELMEKRLVLIKKYKKGLAQKLFPQKGQTNPTLRFKKDDGSNFSDWQVVELRSLAKRISERNTKDVGTVLTNSATRGIVSQQDFFDKDIAIQGNLSNYYMVQRDDFVYNPRISSTAPVGPFNRNNYEIGLMSPLYTVYRVMKNENIAYVERYLQSSAWHRYMKSVANYGARHDRMAISSSDLDDLPIPLPADEERDKITDFLGSLESAIQEQERKLEQAKQFKKALLQQMFV